jgi:hypothetical protein
LSYERSDNRKRHSDSEENEEREYRETDEGEESPEDKADEAAKDLEREEESEKYADEASRELDETESESNEAKDLADDASRELDSMENEGDAERSMEDDLGHDLDEVRDDLHDRFVNDMDRQLEEPSQKETETDEQDSDTDSSYDMTESSESYEDAGNGMVYALESKGGSGEAEAQTETKTEQETADEAEGSNQDVSEPESNGEEPEATTNAVDDELTNRVTRQEYTESEDTEETSTEGTPNHKSSETESDFSKPETSANETADAQSETESDHVNSLDTKSEYSESFKDEGEQSMETSAESEVNETDSYQSEVEDVSEPIEDSDVEQSHEAEPQEVSDEVQRIVESAESELEEAQEVNEGSENEVAETEVSEEEDVLEDLEDFVRRVEDMLDENVDMDDDYDYVQDPLTGEMQRVPKILSEYESEEQRNRRKLRNLFAELSAKERELFKRIVREKAETEEARSAEEVERQWTRVVEKADQSRGRIDIQDVYDLYFNQGLSKLQVANRLGLKSTRPIQHIFSEQGWKFRNNNEYDYEIDFDSVYRLYYDEGLTKEQVAHYLGLTEWVLRKVFKEMNWPSQIQKFETEKERALARKEYVKKRLQRIKDLRKEKFGTKCRICGKSQDLAIHKKDGVEHNKDFLWIKKNLESVNTDDWVALCISCHRGTHWMMDRYEYDWDAIESQAKEPAKQRNMEPLELPSEDTPSSREYLEIRDDYPGDTEALRGALFGVSCYFCGNHYEKRRLPIHRKDGRPHKEKLTKKEKYFRTLNPSEWVSLCNDDHRHVHWAMDILNLEWDDLESKS